MHILYVHMHAYVGGLCAGRGISIMPLVLPHTNSHGVGAGVNMQPVYLLSVAHLEPVVYARYCTGKYRKFVSFEPIDEGKPRLHAVVFC